MAISRKLSPPPDLVSHYLDEHQEGVWDSQGQFTTDFSGVLKRFTPIAQRDPALFLGRFFQAASRAQAQAIEFVILRDRVKVVAQLDRVEDFESALTAFVEHQPSQGVVQSYLFGATVMALAQQPLALHADTRTTQSYHTFDLLNKKKLLIGTCGGRPSVTLECTVEAPGFWQQLLGSAQARANWVHFITERLNWSTLPVQLDGKRLMAKLPDCRALGLRQSTVSRCRDNGDYLGLALLQDQRLHDLPTELEQLLHHPPGLPDTDAAFPKKLMDPFCLVEVEKDPTEFEDQDARHVDSEKSSPVQKDRWQPLSLSLEKNQDPQPWSLAYGFLSDKTNQAGQLFPLVDGLLLTPIAISSWPQGSFAYCDFTQHPTDAEGVQLVQDEKFQSIVASLELRLLRLLLRYQLTLKDKLEGHLSLDQSKRPSELPYYWRFVPLQHT